MFPTVPARINFRVKTLNQLFLSGLKGPTLILARAVLAKKLQTTTSRSSSNELILVDSEGWSARGAGARRV